MEYHAIMAALYEKSGKQVGMLKPELWVLNKENKQNKDPEYHLNTIVQATDIQVNNAG